MDICQICEHFKLPPRNNKKKCGITRAGRSEGCLATRNRIRHFLPHKHKKKVIRHRGLKVTQMCGVAHTVPRRVPCKFRARMGCREDSNCDCNKGKTPRGLFTERAMRNGSKKCFAMMRQVSFDHWADLVMISPWWVELGDSMLSAYKRSVE